MPQTVILFSKVSGGDIVFFWNPIRSCVAALDTNSFFSVEIYGTLNMMVIPGSLRIYLFSFWKFSNYAVFSQTVQNRGLREHFLLQKIFFLVLCNNIYRQSLQNFVDKINILEATIFWSFRSYFNWRKFFLLLNFYLHDTRKSIGFTKKVFKQKLLTMMLSKNVLQ